MNVSLWTSKPISDSFVSVLGTNIIGNDYTFTPNGSLANGNNTIHIDQHGQMGVFSGIMELSGGQTDKDPSGCSKASISGTPLVTTTSRQTSSIVLIIATPTLPSNPASASSISQPLDAQQDSVSKHTISHGAIAGIVIGAVAFLVLISASVLCWRRRRSSRPAVPELPNNSTDAEIKSDSNTTIWVPELNQEGAVYGPHELPGTPKTLEEPLEATETTPTEGRVVEIGDPE